MRFFTLMHKAGRLEYFLVSVALTVANVIFALLLLELEVVIEPGQTVASPENISYNAGALALFVVFSVAFSFLGIINTLRRLKDLNKSYMYIFVFLIPIINILFSLYLLLAPGGWDKGTYTPYGNDPYDPNSWVPPEAPSSTGSGVSYQGQELYLPGEETWGQNDKAA